MQLKPPPLVVAFQAASTKQSTDRKLPQARGTLFIAGSGNGFAPTGRAACQIRASLIAKVATSCSDKTRFSNNCLFLAVQRYHRTHGNRSVALSPDGGRFIMRLQAVSSDAGVEIEFGFCFSKAGIKSHTRVAKGH